MYGRSLSFLHNVIDVCAPKKSPVLPNEATDTILQRLATKKNNSYSLIAVNQVV